MLPTYVKQVGIVNKVKYSPRDHGIGREFSKPKKRPSPEPTRKAKGEPTKKNKINFNYQTPAFLQIDFDKEIKQKVPQTFSDNRFQSN